MTGVPNFSLNDDVKARTRAPPVQIAAAWVRQYPGAQSPLKGTAYPLLNLSQGAPGYLPRVSLQTGLCGKAAPETHTRIPADSASQRCARRWPRI